MFSKVFIKHISKGTLPFDYQYHKASMLNKKLSIGNKEFADKLHDSNSFGCYVSSSIKPYNCVITESGLNFKNAFFIISSVNTEVMTYILDGLLTEPVFNMGKEKFLVTNIEKMKQKKLKSPCSFRTSSPVSVEIQKSLENGKLIPWALYPDDPRFNKQIINNLIKRYIMHYDKVPSDTHFDITNVRGTKKKAIRIGNGKKASYSRCSLFRFDVDAGNDLLHFAHEMGIGEGQNMGFGAIEVV